MSTTYSKTKKKWSNWVKYFIFNFMLFGAFFAFQVNGGENVEAVKTPSVVVHQSNYEGNNTNGTDNNAKGYASGYASSWYIQGTGVSMKDIVTFTLTVPYNEINGIAVFESNYTTAGNKNYDAYKKVDDNNGIPQWESLVNQAGTLKQGKANDATICASFTTGAAMALSSDGTNYSYMCIDEDEANSEIVIRYAYTIRNAEYGYKSVKVVLYNDDAYGENGEVNTQAGAYDYDVNFIVAKPISESSFTWIDGTTNTSCGTNSSGTDYPTTKDICITYVNGETGNQAKTLEVVLPKETAYIHDVVVDTDYDPDTTLGDIEDIKISTIIDNTIYATNTFLNVGSESGKKVVYYYFDFKLVTRTVNDDTSITYTDGGNSVMDPKSPYVITLSVDASGDYVFYFVDIFGNTYTSGKVDVDDVLKTNIIVDYTNEYNLTLMKTDKTDYYTAAGWKGDWGFEIVAPNEVDFAKITKDQITVEVHLFHKIEISNGVFAGEIGDIEPIAKQPLGYKDGNVATDPNQFEDAGIKIWRVGDISGDDGEDTKAVSCGTDECKATAITFDIVGDYTAGNRKNKITFTVQSNGRYRIMVEDKYKNSTKNYSYSAEDNLKNPSVEVSVIDRTNPIVGRENSATTGFLTDGVLNENAHEYTIYSYDYVIGGGKEDVSIPKADVVASTAANYWENPDNYTTTYTDENSKVYTTGIYYNKAGEKAFDYQTALEIADIKVIDPVKYYSSGSIDAYFSAYDVKMGSVSDHLGVCLDVGTAATSNLSVGVYCDPSSNIKSDRNTSATSYDLHSYIISNNITSFSGGLFAQANKAVYESTDYSSVTGTAPTNYVNDYEDATNFYDGYLKIEFKDSSGNLICTIAMDSEKATGALTNKECFNLINQYIDDVEDFSMTFTAQDYNNTPANRHTSNAYVVNVKIVDNTAPAIDNITRTSASPIEYTNQNSICRLEIDNVIQIKQLLLECYKIKAEGSDTYYFKDNNINHEASGVGLDAGEQFYASADSGTTKYSYFSKIELYVLEEGTWTQVTNDPSATTPHLYKSNHHQFKIIISDHWGDEDEDTTNVNHNELTIYVTYYVNPRTLLIEPLANEKMYGEAEPTFDYCVYVNRHNDTFNLEDKFFEVKFINTYFDYIYCTRDVYAKIETANRYSSAAGTESVGYSYNQYTQSDGGMYLKVNNTYVAIVDNNGGAGHNVYSMSYVQNNNGEYFVASDDTAKANPIEIKSGYVYKDSACLYAAEIGQVTDMYLRTSASCVKIEAANRHTQKYVKDLTGGNLNGKYLKYNINTVSADGFDNNEVDNISGNANSALVNNNVFNGKLARVESRCYNTFVDNYYSNTLVTDGTNNIFSGFVSCEENSTDEGKAVRNDNVGQYHIVLGTLSIQEEASTKYNDDYVIKLNTNYVASNFAVGGSAQTITNVKPGSSELVDDGLKSESSVNFTIRQAVLTIKAKESSKKYGEQDPRSHKWNDTTTAVNNSELGEAPTGYLSGYTVTGWRYNGNEDDTENINNESIVLGTLRRVVGENVGIYDICNLSGNPASITATQCNNFTPSVYDENYIYYFADYDNYKYIRDGNANAAGLTINTNGEVYGNGTGRTLNTGTRNYSIIFIGADFKIEARDLIIQPGINQGKEYAATPYNDPLWSLVVYGENLTSTTAGCADSKPSCWVSNIQTSSNVAANSTEFSGYTQTILMAKNEVSPTYNTAPYNAESAVYYARRKTSPESTYTYVKYLNIGEGVIKYEKVGNYYVEKTSSGTGSIDNLYVFAYGNYYQITAANRYAASNGSQSNSGLFLKINVAGRLVNQEDKLFSEDFVLERVGQDATEHPVGWYSYVALTNYKEGPTDIAYYTIRGNGNNQCTIGASSVSTTLSTAVECVNYNVVYVKNAPISTNDGTNITGYITEEGDAPPYSPDGWNACTDGDVYSSACTSNTTEITFEIFKRDVVLEFIDDNYTFIYGERYEYYKNIFDITGTKDNTVEGNIFLCYSDLGNYLVNCTTDPDYGTTAGDTWSSIGLEFHMSSVVSSNASDYYSSSTGKALPAGEYYVYASITDNDNYNFIYRGGTLLIRPKVTNVELTGYTMEYGELYFDSYGVGTNYSDYTSYKLDKCMKEASYYWTGTVTDFISDCTTKFGQTNNVVGNTYGFTIEGLDAMDTIDKNFVGRPQRTTGGENKLADYLDVGYYKIGVGRIATKNNPDIKANVFKECITNLDGGVAKDTGCVFVASADSDSNVVVTGINAVNYDITYSLAHNEGAYLFVLPAKIDITVYPDQTKMYGCAYDEYHDLSNTSYYTYSNTGGYTNCGSYDSSDSSYKYRVEGDKDNATATETSISYDVINTNGTLSYSAEKTKSVVVFNEGNLYRVSYDYTVSYKDAKKLKGDNKYQGQAVGVYTITLGDLNIANNANAGMCDLHNNPVLEGGTQCRNYNINYYGESATTAKDDHRYSDVKEGVALNTLTLYELKYNNLASGDSGEVYVNIDGKFVKIADLGDKYKNNSGTYTVDNATGTHVLISSYASISDLSSRRYDRKPKYKEVNNSCTTNCYIYLGGYTEVSNLTKYNADGTENPSGTHVKVTGTKTNYIALSTITHFEIDNTVVLENPNDLYGYASNPSGDYVYINGKYVQLSSLRKYKQASDNNYVEVTASDTGLTDATTFVQIYEYKAIASLARYTLSTTASDMYEAVTGTPDTNNNLYAFVDGSYVPYNSLITAGGQTTIDVNSANVTVSGTSSLQTGDVTSAVKFMITARVVKVHPEFNIKPYGIADPVEYITCAEIQAANGGSSFNFEGRTDWYCGSDTTNNAENNTTKVDLGVTMYYAMQNTLATHPWTEWTDYVNASKVQERSGYDDIQFDVLMGKVARKYYIPGDSAVGYKNDIANKYTYDFANVTTNDALSGGNYVIEYVTKQTMKDTYVQTTSGAKDLDDLLYIGCQYSSDHCLADGTTEGKTISSYKLKVDNGKVVADGSTGTETSVSLIQKYKSSTINVDNQIDFWYLGFYDNDEGDGRNGELAKWWSQSNRPFACSYNDIVDSTSSCKYNDGVADIHRGANIEDPYFANTGDNLREVYFEIIRRTIYLYAVDVEKIYGEADKYSDFLVAICPNNAGYEKTVSGSTVSIKCKDGTTEAGYAYGLSETDKGNFVDENGVMNQWRIKNNGVSTNADYIFQGTKDATGSFGIYFRRMEGENVGSYTITACAAQSDVPDCTNKAPRTNADYTVEWLGDNYDIIEVPGVLTIKTRVVEITPDAGQGFMYGNYTENGSMPNITFKESHNGGSGLVFGSGTYLFSGSTQIAQITSVKSSGEDTSLYEFTIASGANAGTYTIDGLHVINSANQRVGVIEVSAATDTSITANDKVNTKTLTLGAETYTIIQKARCLISISGLQTTCINDAQNESLANALNENYWEYGVTYQQALSTRIHNGDIVSNNIADKEKAITDWPTVYYTYNVYGDSYSNPANANTRTETSDRSALSIQCGGQVHDRYSRDVCIYKINMGDLQVKNIASDPTSNPFKIVFYVYVTSARIYKLNGDGTYSPDTSGSFVKYGEDLYAPYDEDELVAYMCDSNGKNCEYKKNEAANATNNRYIKVEKTIISNYEIEEFPNSETYNFTVSQAALTVTPDSKQNKIYGEADIEIKFTKTVEYTVTRTNYQNFANSNIIRISNGSDHYDVGTPEFAAFRYNLSGGVYTQAAEGEYILLTKDWVVLLDSYAYDEENETNKTAHLDYGVNAQGDKYTKTAGGKTVTQSATDVYHYDEYIEYKSSITTSRILIGNLYIEDRNQNVGEKNIMGDKIKVGNNNVGSKNYGLSVTANVQFVIVPRPINVKIENITKTYGQATDITSCDSSFYTSGTLKSGYECVVGDGILHNESENGSLLINNFSVITDKAFAKLNDTIATSTYTDGINVVYMDSNADYSRMNLPTDVTSNGTITSAYTSYVELPAANVGKYYTADGEAETKNDDLNIQVERYEEDASNPTNIARGAVCMLNEVYCEDVGEYYLYFKFRGSEGTKDSTIPGAYYNEYWGYNPNYHVIVYNNFEASGWTESGFENITADVGLHSFSGNDEAPTESATLKIRKRPIQIVVETISNYDATESATGDYLGVYVSEGVYTYHLITDTNTYVLNGTKYVQKTMEKSDGNYVSTGDYYLCTYSNTNTSSNCYSINSTSDNHKRFDLQSKTVGDRYAIEQNMDVPNVPGISNNRATHHTTYDELTYNNITWYEQPLQVRIADELFGEVAYCQDRIAFTDEDDQLHSIRSEGCSALANLKYYASGDINDVSKTDKFFNTMQNGYYLITRNTDVLYIRNGDGITNGAYEANNYTTTFVSGVLQIDLDETAPVINVTNDFVSKEANGGVYTLTGSGEELAFLNSLTSNGCAGLVATGTYDADNEFIRSECVSGTTFTYEKDKAGTYVETLMSWFGLSSFDPGIIRANTVVENKDRYNPRWYMAIQADFNQSKSGNYTIFIYAQDDVGNISLATTVTLQVIDTTAPTVGTLNLYSAKVECSGNKDCRDVESWTVSEEIYLPINAMNDYSSYSAGTTNYNNTVKAAYASIITKKYMYTTIGGGVYGFVENNNFGTYYKIPVGTPAAIVSHTGWINSSAGIHMTVTGGDDNSLSYLDISNYDVYSATADFTQIKAYDTGDKYILLGSFVNVANLTKYRKVVLKECTVSGASETPSKCENTTEGATGTVVYIPDKDGTIIRYKGFYYDLETGSYLGLTSAEVTNLGEHKIKLYKLKDGVYTTATTNTDDTYTYYICDGEMYKLPTERYDATGKHDTSGTYINIAQWDHYYSRDGGNSWSKYSRDTRSGYLALNQDGQRLIMIRAIDTGYTYIVDTTFTAKTENKVKDAYCKTVDGTQTCSDWWAITTEAATINKLVKQLGYKVSAWDSVASGERLYKDRQYAYLDTIIPRIELRDDFTDIFEYGCKETSNCNKPYAELFGYGYDGYVYKLSTLDKFNSSGGDGNTHIKINGVLMAIADLPRYKKGAGDVLELDSGGTGDYVYVGKTDSVLTSTSNTYLVTGNALITGDVYTEGVENKLKVYDLNSCTGTAPNITCVVQVNFGTVSNGTSEVANHLQANTKQIASGVGKGNTMFDGVGNGPGKVESDQSFGSVGAAISDKYVQIFIYADVRGGTGAVAGHPHLGAQGYYKFVIRFESSKYKVYSCYSNSTVFGEQTWCASPSASVEYNTMKEAVEGIVAVYKEGSTYNFNGNDIVFTMDYKIFDLAGNASYYERKLLMLYSFTRTIGAETAEGQVVNSMAVNVAQNTNVMQALNDFSIVTTTGKNLRTEERILQSVYYNGALISSRAAYDLDILENLDTSVPGNYRIVYTIERKDGATYAVGNSFELNITVDPEVAKVTQSTFSYGYLIAAMCGVIAIGFVGLFLTKKKRIN